MQKVCFIGWNLISLRRASPCPWTPLGAKPPRPPWQACATALAMGKRLQPPQIKNPRTAIGPMIYGFNAASIVEPHVMKQLTAESIKYCVDIGIVSESHLKTKHPNGSVQIYQSITGFEYGTINSLSVTTTISTATTCSGVTDWADMVEAWRYVLNNYQLWNGQPNSSPRMSCCALESFKVKTSRL